VFIKKWNFTDRLCINY